MRVLVSFEDRVRPDSTGVYIREGFKKLGHEVTHVLPEKMKDVKPGSHDIYVKVDDGLRSGWNKDLHPSHYFCIDTHIETDWRLALAKAGEFDSISVVHPDGLKLPWGRSDVFWLPVACDPQFHNVGKREKKYDVCFIGNFHSQFAEKRIDAVDALFKAFPNFFFGPRTFKDMAEKYAESRIVFNMSLNGDVNMRFFEALCSGSCLVTDYIKDMDSLGFTNGRHYHGYNSVPEMIDLVRYLLDNEHVMDMTARAGQREVLLNHTYEIRCNRILQAIKVPA